MSLVTSMDLLTKIPGGIGCAIEMYGAYNDCHQNCKKIDENYNRLKLIKKDLENKKSNCIYPDQKKIIEETIISISSKLKDKNSELHKEKTKAWKDAGVALLQEGANMALSGGGSLVAGVNRVSSSILAEDNEMNAYEVAQEGIFAGAKDFILSNGADLLADNCCIQ